jgi:hypothetical protein
MNLRERALAACLPVGALSGMEVISQELALAACPPVGELSGMEVFRGTCFGSLSASWCAIGYGGNYAERALAACLPVGVLSGMEVISRNAC